MSGFSSKAVAEKLPTAAANMNLPSPAVAAMGARQPKMRAIAADRGTPMVIPAMLAFDMDQTSGPKSGVFSKK
jgi:hypothetical protein